MDLQSGAFAPSSCSLGSVVPVGVVSPCTARSVGADGTLEEVGVTQGRVRVAATHCGGSGFGFLRSF